MDKNIALLKWSLLAGSVYFALVAVVHMLGIKAPGLFIYFNVPSFGYQDKIISFLSLGWSIFLYTAFLNPIKNIDLIKAILVAGMGAILGLCIINLSTDFTVLSEKINVSVFWWEVLCLGIYLVWLIFFYRQVQNNL